MNYVLTLMYKHSIVLLSDELLRLAIATTTTERSYRERTARTVGAYQSYQDRAQAGRHVGRHKHGKEIAPRTRRNVRGFAIGRRRIRPGDERTLDAAGRPQGRWPHVHHASWRAAFLEVVRHFDGAGCSKIHPAPSLEQRFDDLNQGFVRVATRPPQYNQENYDSTNQDNFYDYLRGFCSDARQS